MDDKPTYRPLTVSAFAGVGKHYAVASHFRRNKIGVATAGCDEISQAAKNRFAKSGQMVSAVAGGPDGLASIFNKNGT